MANSLSETSAAAIRFETQAWPGKTAAAAVLAFAKSSISKAKQCITLLTAIPVRKLQQSEDFLQPVLIVAVLIQTLASTALAFKKTDVDLTMYLAAKALIQGGIHEDGLSDLADASSRHTKTSRLKIMKETKTGAFGSLALALASVLEYVALKPLANASLVKVTAVCSLLSWSSVLWHWLTLPHAFDCHSAIMHRNNAITCALVATAALFVNFRAVQAVVTAVYLVVLNVLFNMWALKKIGGKTGDTLGAIKKLSEVLSIVCLSV
ncbi:adenosylcobinamide-GDP ribazoletransferase [Candidatus Hodgkinia cicadicola]